MRLESTHLPGGHDNNLHTHTLQTTAKSLGLPHIKVGSPAVRVGRARMLALGSSWNRYRMTLRRTS